MGSLANSIFRLMLGWLQGIVAAVWSAFTTEKGGSVFAWFGKYWIPIAGILCVIGLVSDLCVYLVRWKPFQRWFGFLRHDREEEHEVRIRPAQQKETAYAVETTEKEEIHAVPRRRRRMTQAGEQSEETYAVSPEERDYQPEKAEKRAYNQSAETRNSRYAPEYGAERKSANPVRPEPYATDEPDFSKWQEKAEKAEKPRTDETTAPATVTKAGYRVPADSPYRRPETRMERETVPAADETKEETDRQTPVTVGRRRRLRIADLFTDPEEELRQAEAPQHVIDSSKAYRQPVYPRGWKKSESDGQ